MHLTIGILFEARKNGINIPKDLGIITFGTLLSSEIIQPQITSIEQPEKEIAEISFQLLEKLMEHETLSHLEMIREVKAEIVFRESC